MEWIAEQGFEVSSLPAPPLFDARADAVATAAALDEGPRPDWLVADHYGICADWETVLRPSIDQILVIDDLNELPHVADVLVNPNPKPLTGSCAQPILPACTKLVGPRFALLRPEFAAVRGHVPCSRPTQESPILACMGGTDPQDVLSTVLAAWQLLPTPRPALDIAVGHGSPNLTKLLRNCAGLHDVRLHVAPNDMAALMAQSRMLVGSAGSISWERCCVGLAAIIGSTAANQRANLEVLVEKRTGVSVGEWTQTAPEDLASMMQRLLRRPGLLDRLASRARQLVDGLGAQRVAAVMLREALSVRPAVVSDAVLAWPWRNAASTRRHSHDPTPVDLDRHVAWWNSVLCDDRKALLIGVIGSLPIGVLRLDRDDAQALVSIYLDPALTGLGLGPALLRAGLRWSRQRFRGIERLHAEILPGNRASISAFRDAGFVEDDSGAWTHEV